MMGNGFGGGMMVYGLALMLGIFLLVVLGIWALATWLRSSRSTSGGAAGGGSVPPAGHSRAREVLDERYARGELSTEEYRERLHALEEER